MRAEEKTRTGRLEQAGGPCRQPGKGIPRVDCRRPHSQAHLDPAVAPRQPTGHGRSKLLMDAITDPDPRVGLLQAQTRNMRSKCRCSYVLQFTWHLGVSSVLHRPLSQIIHCIVLYLDFQTFRSECRLSANKGQLDSPARGEITTQTA